MLEKNPDWLRPVALLIKIIRVSFLILVYGVRIGAINTADQKTIITNIYEENRRLYSDIKIIKVFKIRKAIK
jgi:hypothetical protein